MTHSGFDTSEDNVLREVVLIPLLLDDPLWVISLNINDYPILVLIPLLLDDPLWEIFFWRRGRF